MLKLRTSLLFTQNKAKEIVSQKVIHIQMDINIRSYILLHIFFKLPIEACKMLIGNTLYFASNKFKLIVMTKQM